jgi:GT2 family glycosyltransferase
VKLSVVIVNFNNDRVLRGCLEALPVALEGLDAEIILSDNGSTDGSVDWVRRKYPEVRIIENNENLGFAEANNRAFPQTQGDFILLLNPDTIVQNDAFRPMLEILETRPQAGAVGCKLLNADGSRQISARSFPTISTYCFHFLGLAYRFPENRRFGALSMTYWDGSDRRQVDWVSGAALMIRRDVLVATGGIDSYFFLTYDEVDWCHRIRKAGYEIWYTPDGVIVHLDRQSEPQSNPNPEGRIKYMTVERNSRVRYFVKHHGRLYAFLVEVVHILMSGALWLKARVFGTNQPAVATMEHRLMLTLYWRTALRIPRAVARAMLRLVGRSGPYRIFENPYLRGSGD